MYSMPNLMVVVCYLVCSYSAHFESETDIWNAMLENQAEIVEKIKI